MKPAALAIRDLLARIAAAFGLEGAWLLAGAVLLSVWAYLVIDPRAPWLICGALSILAFLALATRRSG